MIYSNYLRDQFTSPIYEKVSQKLLTLAKDEDTKRKMRRDII